MIEPRKTYDMPGRARGPFALGMVAFTVWAISSGASVAQTAVPGGALPGQIEDQFKRQPAPRVAPPVELPAGPLPALPDDARKIEFAVTEVRLEGATVLPQERIDALLAPYANRQTSLASIYELAERLTSEYRNSGYVLTRVIVPEQRITDGRVKLVAIEGYLDQVLIEGAKPAQAGLLQAYADRIKASRPLRAEVLERYLLLMNDLSGAYAQAVVRASPAGVGAAELLIQFSSRSVDASLEVNNRGSHALGPVNLVADVLWHSPLGAFDELHAAVATTPNDELQFVSVGYSVPVGSDGLSVGVSGSLARAHPDVGPGLDVRTRSASGQLNASYAALRSRTRNLYLRAALTWLDGRTEISGLPLTNDKVRSVRLGMSFDLTDRWLGVNSAELDLVQGLNVAGATRSDAVDSSRVGASPTFRKLTVYAARLQSVVPQVDLLAAVSAQYAREKLFPSEQFGFGGGTFGRAYEASELLGDSGAALKLELRYAGSTASPVWRAYTVYGFYELGKVWRRDPINQPARDSAADAGLGVRFNLLTHLSGYVEAAKPLTRDADQHHDRGARLSGALRWTF